MSCDPSELLQDAGCIACLSQAERDTIKTQLLCDIFDLLGGGGGGGAFLEKAQNLADLTSVPTALNNLGLGAGDSPGFTGLTLSGLTEGSVLFAGPGGVVSQDNANLFFNDSTNRLQVGDRTEALTALFTAKLTTTLVQTAPATFNVGLSSVVSNSANSTADVAGVYVLTHSAGTTGSVVVNNNILTHSGGVSTTVTGINNSITLSGGTITNFYGSITNPVASGATITNAYSLYLQTLNGGTVTNRFGLFLESRNTADKMVVLKMAAAATGNVFEIQDSTSAIQSVINSDSDMGLGTGTPNDWASVTGVSGRNLQIYHATLESRLIINSASAAPEIHLIRGSNTADNKVYRFTVNSGDITLDQPADAYATTVQLATFTNAGNLGIGTSTPNAWSSVAGVNGRNLQIFHNTGGEAARLIINSGFSSAELHMVLGSNAANDRNYRFALSASSLTLDQPSDDYSTTQHIMTWTNTAKVLVRSSTSYSAVDDPMEVNVNSNYGGYLVNGWLSGAEFPLFTFQRSKSATIGTHTVVASGDVLGFIGFRGSGGTSFHDAAVIKTEVDGTPGNNDMPGRLMFLTTPDGSTTSVERMRITNNGHIAALRSLSIGSNTDPGDNNLQLDGDYTALGSTITTNVTKAQIVANTNDYAIGAGTSFRLSTDASRNITGIAGGVDGRIIRLFNIGSFDIVLTNEDAASAAANRFTTSSGGNITLTPNDSISFVYDGTTSRWRDL